MQDHVEAKAVLAVRPRHQAGAGGGRDGLHDWVDRVVAGKEEGGACRAHQPGAHDGEVDVRRAVAIAAGHQSVEEIAPFRIGPSAAPAKEIRVSQMRFRVGRVVEAAGRVGLPCFQHHVHAGGTALPEHQAMQGDGLAAGAGSGIGGTAAQVVVAWAEEALREEGSDGVFGHRRDGAGFVSWRDGAAVIAGRDIAAVVVLALHGSTGVANRPRSTIMSWRALL